MQTIQQHPQGFVPLETLLTFNRLRQLTTSEAAVASALAGSQLLQLDDDKRCVRRIRQLSTEKKRSMDRSVHVSGLPVALEDPLRAIQNLFAEAGKIEYVKVLYDFNQPVEGGDAKDPQQPTATTKTFSGSALVDYYNEKSAKAALEKKWECEGHELKVVSKCVFIFTLDLEEFEQNNAFNRLFACTRSNDFPIHSHSL